MTRDQIAAKVLGNLEDSGIKFFSASDVNNSIQDAYDDVCCYCGQLEKSARINFQDNLVYYDAITLIPDFYTVTAIYNYNTKRWLLDTATQELDQIRWDWELWHGSPIWFCPHDFRYIVIAPTLSQATGSMEIFYKATAPTLGAGDTPLIKSDSVKLLEFYATGDLLESVKEYSKADNWLRQYFKIRERYKRDVKTLAEADRMLMIEQSSLRILP